MGVSTTHRINLSMWILIYSFSDTYYVWAACGRIFPLRLNTLDNARENEICFHSYQSYKQDRIYRCGEFDLIQSRQAANYISC